MNTFPQNLGRRDGQSAECRRDGPGAVGGRLPKSAFLVAQKRGIVVRPYGSGWPLRSLADRVATRNCARLQRSDQVRLKAHVLMAPDPGLWAEKREDLYPR